MRAIFLNWRDLAHPRSGGAEVLAQGLAQRLARAGHAVVFFSAHVSGVPDDEEIDGVHHVRRGGRYAVYGRAYRWLKKTRPHYDVLIDHINTVPFFTPLYTSRRTIALVPQLARDVWWYEAPKILSPAGIASERFYHSFYRRTPAITVSESTENDLRAFGWRAPIRKIAMPIPAPPETRIEKRTQPTMVYVGRLTPSKRVEHAIAAFKTVRSRLPNAELWIVGQADDPTYEARLLAAAGAVGGVQFLGRLAEDERQRRMASAHVLIVTSVREGWGLVVTEANSVGTPAVGYDVPGLRDSIKAGQGILARSGDHQALGAATAGLLSDPQRLADMSQRARADAAQYSWARTYTEFTRALRDLVPGLEV